MTDYKEMYFLLFNKITDTIESLQEIQQQAEEMYIAQDESSSNTIKLSAKEWYVLTTKIRVTNLNQLVRYSYFSLIL